MTVEIIRGGPDPDLDCLHCVLPPIINEFVKAHPGYQGGIQALVDLAMVCGELVASGIFNSGNRQLLEQVLEIMRREMRRSAIETLETLDRKKRQ